MNNMNIKEMKLIDWQGKQYFNVTIYFDLMNVEPRKRIVNGTIEQLTQTMQMIATSGGSNLRAYLEDGTELV